MVIRGCCCSEKVLANTVAETELLATLHTVDQKLLDGVRTALTLYKIASP